MGKLAEIEEPSSMGIGYSVDFLTRLPEQTAAKHTALCDGNSSMGLVFEHTHVTPGHDSYIGWGLQVLGTTTWACRDQDLPRAPGGIRGGRQALPHGSARRAPRHAFN